MKSLQMVQVSKDMLINPAHVVSLQFWPEVEAEPIRGDEGGADGYPAQLHIRLSSVHMETEGYETMGGAASVSDICKLNGPQAVAVWEMFQSYALYPQAEPAEERHLQ